MIQTIPPSLNYIPEDDSSLKKFGTMLNEFWKTLSRTLSPFFNPAITYTPTLTPLAGAYTAASAKGRYLQIGKWVYLNIQVNIVTAGTGTYPKVSLPIPADSNQNTSLVGGENNVIGFSVWGDIGFTGDFSKLFIRKFDGTDPVNGVNGLKFSVSGWYEIA